MELPFSPPTTLKQHAVLGSLGIPGSQSEVHWSHTGEDGLMVEERYYGMMMMMMMMMLFLMMLNLMICRERGRSRDCS